MRRLKCAEIWGGIKNQDLDVCTPGLIVSLYSSSCVGGKGGDVYYFSLCSADRVTRIVLADVVGHGEQVSQISQWVYQQLAARLDDADLPGMMTRINARVMQKGLRAMTTAVVLSYYRDLNRMYYCYAGHPPMLVRDREGNWGELPSPGDKKGENLPLGVANDTCYSMGEAPLRATETLLIYSDGLLEARHSDGGFFGKDRLCAALAERGDAGPSELKRRILDRLHAWTGGSLDHDDVTLMAVQADEHWNASAE